MEIQSRPERKIVRTGLHRSRPIYRTTIRRIRLAVYTDNTLRQVTTSCDLRANLADVLLSTADLPGNTRLTQSRPSPKRKLDGMSLIGTAQPLAMRTVRTESEPQRVSTGADVDVGLDLVPPRATKGLQPMEAIGKAVARAVAEHDHRREPDPLAETLGIVIDDMLGDRLAHLGARVDRHLVDTEHAPFGHLIKRRRRDRRRHGHEITRRGAGRRHAAEAYGTRSAGRIRRPMTRSAPNPATHAPLVQPARTPGPGSATSPANPAPASPETPEARTAMCPPAGGRDAPARRRKANRH